MQNKILIKPTLQTTQMTSPSAVDSPTETLRIEINYVGLPFSAAACLS